jgi:hypothetical protein
MSKKATREEIEKFVKENLTRVDQSGRVVCIDGRINPEQSEGAIRAPGGDFGIIMAFAGALKDEGTFIDPGEIIERYSRAKKQEFGQDTKFDYHCDSHNHNKGKIGCAHIANASDPKYDGLYGSLIYTDVRKLFDAFTKNHNSNLTILEGHHEEKAVLMVYGHPQDEDVAYSIHSRDRKGNMYFVADIDRAINLIKKLTPQFSVGLQVPVSADVVIIDYLKQLEATVDLIASDKDKHRITVDNERNFSMEQLPRSKPQQPNQ